MGLRLMSGDLYVSKRPGQPRDAHVAGLGDISGRPCLDLFVLLALGVAAVLALFAGAARAEAPRLIPDGQFESLGALGVAVDQSVSGLDPSRGDVYVAGFVTFPFKPGTTEPEIVPGRVNKFDAAGNLLAPPSPVGEAFTYSGTAVDPANGNVYVLDALSSEIDTYDPASGALLSSFGVPASGNYSGPLELFGISATVVGISTDTAGNVYVPVVPSSEVCGSPPTSCVLEYSPTGSLLKTFTGGSGRGALSGPTGVSVDPSGNVWIADAGNGRIVEVSPADAFIGEISSEGVQSIAVDPHDDVFAILRNSADFCGKLRAPCAHLVEYSSAGVQLDDIGVGSIGAEAVKQENLKILPDMVAVSDSSGSVYVTEGVTEPRQVLHSRVFKFAPPVAPKLESELAVEMGTSEAKLGAVVNPGGIGAAYRFEYGTTTSYGKAVPSPEGDTGGGFNSRTVWADPSGLLQATTYHYRVVVTSDLGTVVGEDRTFTTAMAGQTGCPNEQLRTGFSASLPDCRAYELVTPPNKTSAEPDPPGTGISGNVEATLVGNLAAVDGNQMSFEAEDVFPGSKSAGIANSYVAMRGPGAWSSESVIPPKNYYGYECVNPAAIYSADLLKEIMVVAGGGECGGPEPELVSGEPKGVSNVFVRDNINDSYQLINVSPQDVTPTDGTFVGASPDLGHVVFEEEAKLTPNALSGVKNLYEWSGGVVRLLTVLPDGTSVAGAFAGISHDGSQIFFTDAGKLYARVNGTTTVQVDEARGGSGPGGGGNFVVASTMGSRVIFTDNASAGLTGDTVPGSGTNLYAYDFESGGLTDLTPREHVEVKGVMGASEDGSYVYFEAEGSLVPGAVQGQPNRYVWHGGATTFLATLTNVSLNNLRVSRNGAFLAFESSRRLTGYDNTDLNTGEPDPEFYLYDAAANDIVCASCNPSGAPPTGGPRVETNLHEPRNLSESGRVFFDTYEGLLPADTNEKQDVYEFEPDGVGSCDDPGGCVSLISTGTGDVDTWFIEASPSGDDVFLLEYQKLVPQDSQEGVRRIYDVRVDGGFPEPATPPPCAAADGCRTTLAPQPSIFGTPASQTFSGAGNFAPPSQAKTKPKPKTVKCRKGYVRKRGKCLKKHGKRARGSTRTNKRTGK